VNGTVQPNCADVSLRIYSLCDLEEPVLQPPQLGYLSAYLHGTDTAPYAHSF